MDRRASPESDPAAPERALLSLLGLAARARATVTGTGAARGAVREGKAAAVLLAADASPTQAAKLLPLLRARGTPFAVCLTQDELGTALGRGRVSAVAVTDPNLARRIVELAGAPSQPQDVQEESRTDASL
jgi:ribosomal protein L7Ae-like RNA K-turn-binding protein